MDISDPITSFILNENEQFEHFSTPFEPKFFSRLPGYSDYLMCHRIVKFWWKNYNYLTFEKDIYILFI